jgi:hypothetical protein
MDFLTYCNYSMNKRSNDWFVNLRTRYEHFNSFLQISIWFIYKVADYTRTEKLNNALSTPIVDNSFAI